MKSKWKSFEVFGVQVPIKFFDQHDAEDILGYCTREPLAIHVRKGLSEKETAKTILHELCHALQFRLGFDQVMEASTQELLCEAFSDVVYENFKRK